MKNLSFLELEKEMEKENRIITDEEELKSIGGGKQSGMDGNMGFATTDPFGFHPTTIVNEQGIVHSPTTNPYGIVDNPYGMMTYHTSENTTTNFPTTTQDKLHTFINSHFEGLPNNTIYKVASEGNLPEGYSIGENGNIIDSQGNTASGIAYGKMVNGEFTSEVVIAPSTMDLIDGGSYDKKLALGVVGHEIVHSYNMQAHQELYNENNSDIYQLNSEYAAYKFQYEYYVSQGMYGNAATCLDKMNSTLDSMMSEGVNNYSLNWKDSLLGIPGIPDTTGIPTSTTPTTTISTTTTIPSTTV